MRGRPGLGHDRSPMYLSRGESSGRFGLHYKDLGDSKEGVTNIPPFYDLLDTDTAEISDMSTLGRCHCNGFLCRLERCKNGKDEERF